MRRVGFGDWKEAVQNADRDCPWPGPRPLGGSSEDQRRLAIRNQRDLPEIIDLLLSHKLLILTGESGVGKTSLMQAALQPALVGGGYTVLVIRDYDGLTDPESFLSMILGNLAGIYGTPRGFRKGNTPESNMALIDASAWANKIVVVLDQFEEVLRQEAAVAQVLLDGIEALNKGSSIRVVLSLRSEYVHRLRPLELRCRPFTVTKYVLESLGAGGVETTSEVTAIVDAPYPNNEQVDGDDNADADATQIARAVGNLWAEAGTAGAGHRFGILHLQAFLFETFFKWSESKGSHDDAQPVWNLQEDELRRLWAMNEDANAAPLFQTALEQALERKLGSCGAACRAVREADVAANQLGDGADRDMRAVDERLVTGVRHKIGRMVPLLGSGDYKQIVRVDELVRHVIPSVWTWGSGTDNLVSEVIAELGMAEDLLALSPAEHNGEANDGRTAGNGSGPLLGATDNVIVFEEVRQALFGIEWLVTSGIVRRTTLMSEESSPKVVALVHDGFAGALRRWEQGLREATEPESRLTITRGKVLPFGTAYADPEEATHPDIERPIVNVRWRDSSITGEFDHTLFVNCDLRGSTFDEASFCGVTFVNCLLDGVTFLRCAIKNRDEGVLDGRAENPVSSPETGKPAPSFSVDVGAQRVDDLLLYGAEPPLGFSADGHVFSETAGMPAVPAGDREPNSTLSRAVSGIAIVGGRLNVITFVGGTYDDGARVTFSRIVGSSLEFVEQTRMRLDVFDSEIRGLAVTADVHLGERASVDARVSDTWLGNAWFGEHLRGHVDVNLGMIVQLAVLDGNVTKHPDEVNDPGRTPAHEPQSLTVTLGKCYFAGTLDVNAYRVYRVMTADGEDDSTAIIDVPPDVDFRTHIGDPGGPASPTPEPAPHI